MSNRWLTASFLFAVSQLFMAGLFFCLFWFVAEDTAKLLLGLSTSFLVWVGSHNMKSWCRSWHLREKHKEAEAAKVEEFYLKHQNLFAAILEQIILIEAKAHFEDPEDFYMNHQVLVEVGTTPFTVWLDGEQIGEIRILQDEDSFAYQYIRILS